MTLEISKKAVENLISIGYILVPIVTLGWGTIVRPLNNDSYAAKADFAHVKVSSFLQL